MSLNAEREIAPQGEIQPKPSTFYSATQAFEKPFYEVGLAASAIGERISPGLSSPEFRRGMADKIDVINNNLSDPRLGLAQQGFNTVSGIVGSIAPTAPLGFAGGLVGRFAMGAAGMAARGVASEAFTSLAQKPLSQMVAGNYAKYFPLIGEASLSGTTKAAVESYSAYKGFVIPEHIAENYHKENDTLNVHQAIKDWSADNYGFLIPTASIAAGYIAFKAARIPGVKRANMAEFRKNQEAHLRTKANPLTTSQETNFEKNLYNAVKEGKITQTEHDWYLQYLENPQDHEGLMQSSKKVLDEARIPHDGNGNHWFEILSNEDVNNLKSAVADQSSTYFSGTDASTLTDYVVHNRMDAMRTMMAENPNIVDGLRGYSDHIENKLGMRSQHFKALDEIIDRHLPKGLGKKELFSQNNIYKHLKKMGVHDASEVPYIVPEGVRYKLKLAKKIDDILSRKGARFEQWYKEGLHEKLKEELKSIKLLNPADELADLRSKLFPSGELIKNHKTKKFYHRLEELSQLWSNAKHLLDRVNLEAQYGRQEAFNNILKHFLDMVDSNAQRLANPAKVTDYIKRRIEDATPFVPESRIENDIINDEVRTSFEGKEVKREGETKVDPTEKTYMLFDSMRKQIEDYGSDLDKEEFSFIEQRYNQLKDNEDALSKLVECALGGK